MKQESGVLEWWSYWSGGVHALWKGDPRSSLILYDNSEKKNGISPILQLLNSCNSCNFFLNEVSKVAAASQRPGLRVIHRTSRRRCTNSHTVLDPAKSAAASPAPVAPSCTLGSKVKRL